MALQAIQATGRYEIVGLLTTLNQKYQRISMHGVRRRLLHQQAAALGLPLIEVILPDKPSMESYQTQMESVLASFYDQGVRISIFGDIFLEDVRHYREKLVNTVGMQALFPLWQNPTARLAQQFVQRGFKGVTVCVSDHQLGRPFIGRELDSEFFASLPANVDPCGENGEYHTFVYDGPIFQYPLAIKQGDIVYRTYSTPTRAEERADQLPTIGFWFCDLLLTEDQPVVE